MLETAAKKTELEKYVDQKLKESKLPNAVTKAFREAAGEIKSQADFDSKFKIFTAAQVPQAEGLSFAFVEKAASVETSGNDSALDFSVCAE